MGGRPTYTFLQRIHSDKQKHEKILNITNQRNANKIYNEASLHNGQNGHNNNLKKNAYIQTINAEESAEKGEPLTLYKTTMWCAQSLNRVHLFATPQTVAGQAPLSVGILQARILEWVARPSSRRSFQPRDQTQVSHFADGATREA